jgi:hypothetical protein
LQVSATGELQWRQAADAAVQWQQMVEAATLGGRQQLAAAEVVKLLWRQTDGGSCSRGRQ